MEIMVCHVNESDVSVEELLCINGINTDVTSIRIKDVTSDFYREADVYCLSVPDKHFIYHIRKTVTLIVDESDANDPIYLVSISVYEYDNGKSRTIHNEQFISRSQVKHMSRRSWNKLIDSFSYKLNDKNDCLIIPSSGIVTNQYFNEKDTKVDVIDMSDKVEYNCRYIDYNMVYQKDTLYIDDKYYYDSFHHQADSFYLEKGKFDFVRTSVGAPHYFRSEYAQVIGYNNKKYEVIYKFTLSHVDINGTETIVDESGYTEIDNIKDFKSFIREKSNKIKKEVNKIKKYNPDLIDDDATFIEHII